MQEVIYRELDFGSRDGADEPCLSCGGEVSTFGLGGVLELAICQSLMPEESMLANLKVLVQNCGWAVQADKWPRLLSNVAQEAPAYSCAASHIGALEIVGESGAALELRCGFWEASARLGEPYCGGPGHRLAEGKHDPGWPLASGAHPSRGVWPRQLGADGRVRRVGPRASTDRSCRESGRAFSASFKLPQPTEKPRCQPEL